MIATIQVLVNSMQMLMVDPSLFTLAYDDHLCSALSLLGCDVTLMGRLLRPGETFLPSFYTKQRHFYPLSERLSALPRRLRSTLKGFEHLIGMANLNRKASETCPSVIHFQWLPLPHIDRVFLKILRKRCPLVLTMHDSAPYNNSPVSRLQKAGVVQAIDEFDQIIVHTASSRDRLLDQGVNSERISVVPHGVLNAP
ncbi:MAG: glycosyltransferase, partial [Acidobacteria bacterium]|nr:glycosyltransferase [Acidobacteriota bacterium]